MSVPPGNAPLKAMLDDMPGVPWPDRVKPWVLMVIDLFDVARLGVLNTAKLLVSVIVEAVSGEAFAAAIASRNCWSVPAVKSAAEARDTPPRLAAISAANETPALKKVRLEYRLVNTGRGPLLPRGRHPETTLFAR
ncbi:hypothetical protein [Mesorhizobium amorphae]|uniref:hypothetical protein n=1 Tax=Mesorhizobium amorphae TaxID=71433 RepID=UPI0011868AAA|nr:hypothetical protein [Mesorhizobium amorphae]